VVKTGQPLSWCAAVLVCVCVCVPLRRLKTDTTHPSLSCNTIEREREGCGDTCDGCNQSPELKEECLREREERERGGEERERERVNYKGLRSSGTRSFYFVIFRLCLSSSLKVLSSLHPRVNTLPKKRMQMKQESQEAGKISKCPLFRW
jgi:hypothetical protein